jgi:prepilin-type processing-associated H-X9-DG protein
LIELLVVIAVVAILAALVFVGAQSAMRSSGSVKSLSNMKQLAGALINCAGENNGQFPSYRIPSSGIQPTWDLQCLPYLGISDAVETPDPYTPTLKQGLGLDLFLCPLDKRKSDKASGYYPRSYGLTYVTVAHVYDGGILRNQGEGIRLSQIPKPGGYVLLVRFHRPYETTDNVVGAFAKHVYGGPSPTNLSDPVQAESWAIYGGKTPYAFADGHVQMLTPEQALPLYPLTWNVNK